MDMLSLFRRRAGRAEPRPADAPDAVQAARTRARRRLVGAVVLVAAGIVVFPVLFETQPRPIPIDLPIEIPRKEGAPPLALPGARSAPATADVTDAAAPPGPDARRGARADATPADDPVITETPADAGREVLPPQAPTRVASAAEPARSKTGLAAPASAPRRTAVAASKPAEVRAADGKPAGDVRTAAASKPAATAKPAASKPAAERSAERGADLEAARAQALLEGRAPAGRAVDAAPASAAGNRFVVQVGAFSEDGAVREARSKLERLGLKTYVQVVDTPSGKRTRVRVGPYASRDEAERATAKIRSSALSAVIIGQ